MSYDSKIQFVHETIDAHNSTVDDSLKIDFDKLMENLRKLGATTDATLKGLTHEDLKNECGLPVAIARTVAHHFRKDSNGSTDGKSAYVSDKKVKLLSHRALLERYSPKDKKSPVAKWLKELSDGKAFIVFNKNNRVNVEESLKLLNDIMDDLPELTTTHVEGVPVPVYKVGERPDFYLDENPLYPEEALRSGETCPHTGRSWTGIPLEVRQLLYLALDEELVVETPSDAIDAINRAIDAKGSTKELRGRYPQASLKFDELSNVGQLPLLKVRIGSGPEGGKGNDPFGENTTY